MSQLWSGGNWWGVYLVSKSTAPLAFFTFKQHAEEWRDKYYPSASIEPMRFNKVVTTKVREEIPPGKVVR